MGIISLWWAIQWGKLQSEKSCQEQRIWRRKEYEITREKGYI